MKTTGKLFLTLTYYLIKNLFDFETTILSNELAVFLRFYPTLIDMNFFDYAKKT